MAWGCKHAGPCGWANKEWFEWWCDVCERSGPLPGHPDIDSGESERHQVRSTVLMNEDSCNDPNCYRCIYPWGNHCECCPPDCPGNT